VRLSRGVQKYLSEKAAAAVQALLPESAGGELSAVCPWADQVRWHYHWSSPLHYVNTPQVCNFKYSRMAPLSSLDSFPFPFHLSPAPCSPRSCVNGSGFNCDPLIALGQFTSQKRALLKCWVATLLGAILQ